MIGLCCGTCAKALSVFITLVHHLEMDSGLEVIVTRDWIPSWSKVLGDQSSGYRMLYALSEGCEDDCYA